MRKAKSYSKEFNNALTKSAIAHAILILITLIAFRNQMLPEEQQPLDVVMVELTRGNSEELGDTPPEVQHLPENTIEEQKNPMPDSKDAITTAPTRVETAKAPPAVDTKTMKDPEKAVKKPQPSGVDAATAAALAKINNQLNQRKITAHSSQTDGKEGYKYGNTDKAVKVDGGNAQYIMYRNMVKAKVQREWIRPPLASGVKLKVVISVKISTNGQVISKVLTKKSGDFAFDNSIMRAIDRASPFPVPPPEVKHEALTQGFQIQF